MIFRSWQVIGYTCFEDFSTHVTLSLTSRDHYSNYSNKRMRFSTVLVLLFCTVAATDKRNEDMKLHRMSQYWRLFRDSVQAVKRRKPKLARASSRSRSRAPAAPLPPRVRNPVVHQLHRGESASSLSSVSTLDSNAETVKASNGRPHLLAGK